MLVKANLDPSRGIGIRFVSTTTRQGTSLPNVTSLEIRTNLTQMKRKRSSLYTLYGSTMVGLALVASLVLEAEQKNLGTQVQGIKGRRASRVRDVVATKGSRLC